MRGGYPPLCEQPIRWNGGIEHGRQPFPIVIDGVAPNNRAQFIDVEVRVARLKRIKRPDYQRHSGFNGMLPLRKLHLVADVMMPPAFQDRSKVRVIHNMLVDYRDHRVYESD